MLFSHRNSCLNHQMIDFISFILAAKTKGRWFFVPSRLASFWAVPNGLGGRILLFVVLIKVTVEAGIDFRLGIDFCIAIAAHILGAVAVPGFGEI